MNAPKSTPGFKMEAHKAFKKSPRKSKTNDLPNDDLLQTFSNNQPFPSNSANPDFDEIYGNMPTSQGERPGVGQTQFSYKSMESKILP